METVLAINYFFLHVHAPQDKCSVWGSESLEQLVLGKDLPLIHKNAAANKPKNPNATMIAITLSI